VQLPAGVLQAQYVLGIALFAMLAGDTLMFLLGATPAGGCWAYSAAFPLNPEACILRSADSFLPPRKDASGHRQVYSGNQYDGAPLAGSMNMRLTTFLRLDLAGAALYTGSYCIVGYVIQRRVGGGYSWIRHRRPIVGWIVIALIVGYILLRCVVVDQGPRADRGSFCESHRRRP